MTLEVVVEICSVTLRCRDNAKALLAVFNYPQCIIHRFKCERVPHDGMSTFFRHKSIITLAVATGIFPSSALFFFFFFACKMQLLIAEVTACFVLHYVSVTDGASGLL